MGTVTVEKTVGLKNVGTSTAYISQDTKVACKYDFPDDANITKLTVYTRNLVTDSTTHVKGFIYSDNNGAPGALLATTEEKTCDWNSPCKLLELPFSNPVYVKAGTYWIGFFFEYVGAETDMDAGYAGGDTNQWAEAADDYTDGPSESFGTPTYYNRKLVIFATYTTNVNIKYPPAIKGYTVATVSTTESICWQEKSFAAAGRIWVFYTDVGEPGAHKAMYTSSADGVSWETPVKIHDSLESDGECLQAILERKGSEEYVHVFVRAHSGADYAIWYRRGLLNSDGSITWTADWAEAFHASGSNTDFFAVLDSYGYPWITWGFGAHPDDVVLKITKSSRNDGIWETADGYPQTLSDDEGNNNFIVALSNGKLYVFYFKTKISATETGNYGNIKGRLYNGTTWLPEETVTTSQIINQYTTGRESWSRGVAVDDNDNIHLVFVDQKLGSMTPPFSYNLRYVKRTWGEGWGEEEIIEPDILYKNISPAIVKHGDMIEVFWTGSPAKNIIFSKALDSDGYWSRTVYRVDETEDGIPLRSEAEEEWDGMINSFPQLYENKVGLLWMANGDEAGTYKIKFGYKSAAYRPYTKSFQDLLKVFKNLPEHPNFQVTRHALTLGSRDSVTGWYAKEYTDSTIEMIIIPKSSQHLALKVGYYVALDALGFTLDYVRVGDQISDSIGRTYEVKAVKPVGFGDSIRYYVCDLKELPLHE